MKGPSEEEHVPYYANQPSYHHQNMLYYQAPFSQQFPQQQTNLNGNNSGNYHHQNPVPHQGVMNSHYYPYQPPGEPSLAVADDSDPFAEYAWMANAEEFEKQVLEQMEQEEYFEAFVQELFENEEDECNSQAQGNDALLPPEVNDMNRLTLNETQAPRPPTMLNPNAAEFIPRWAMTHQL